MGDLFQALRWARFKLKFKGFLCIANLPHSSGNNTNFRRISFRIRTSPGGSVAGLGFTGGFRALRFRVFQAHTLNPTS